ncbi:hypothetical protein C0995_003689 [Termitomyces sp. Mi166|nr:hypothetical protein C0995_003689 [Termitomyces sp. Mi166\
MYFSAAFFASIALVFPTFAISNHLVNVTKSAGITNGGYIVTFKSNNATLSFANGNVKVHCYKIINGCTGKFIDKDIQELQANPNVEGIYEDIAGNGAVYQTNATWGLARLSSKEKLEYWNIIATNFTFNYYPSAGQGVDIYVIDLGVYVNHTDFGGRARWGKTFGEYPDIDGHGHGTHCAAIAAGTTYGVAKHANIIAVKVIDERLHGWVSDMIYGLDYVYESVKASGKPSIVSASLTWDAFLPLDRAVAKLTAENILLFAAAGNDATDASLFSPGRAPSAITVAASNITDYQTAKSNYGPAVDLFAPGENIVSAWIGNEKATQVISGTSMALLLFFWDFLNLGL